MCHKTLQLGIATILCMTSLLFTLSARAENIAVDGVTAAFELPKGYCALGHEHPVDKAYYEQQAKMQEGHNKIVVYGVPCKSVDAVHKGGQAPEWAMWLMATPQGVPIRSFLGIKRQDFTDQIAKEFPKLDMKAIETVASVRTATEGVGVKVVSSGLIDQDSSGVYIAILLDVAKNKQNSELAGVYSEVLMSGRVFTLNLYRPFDNRETFTGLLSDVKDATARSASASDALPVDKSLPKGMSPPEKK